MDEIKGLIGSQNLSAEGDEAYRELMNVMSGVRAVRDAVTRGTIMSEGNDVMFDHRSKNRKFTRQDVLDTEEMTNYAAHAAVLLRDALGDKEIPITSRDRCHRAPLYRNV